MSLSIDKARAAVKLREQVELSHAWMRENPTLSTDVIVKFLREHAGQEVKVDSTRREGFTYLTATFNHGLDLPPPWEQEPVGGQLVKCRIKGIEHAAAVKMLVGMGHDAQYCKDKEDRIAGWALVILQ